MTTQTLQEKILSIRNNPQAINRLMLRTLQNATNGQAVIMDASGPFPYLMTAACNLASAAMAQNDANNSKQYPVMAQTQDDLYHHMSDTDYLNRFAVPAKTYMTFFLSLDEVKQKAVKVYDSSGNKIDGLSKLTIPRFTRITAVGTPYTMQYPIDIFVSSYNGQNNVNQNSGIRVLFDTSRVSPLYSLSTDQVDWNIGYSNGVAFIRITIPIYQMDISSQVINLNNVTGFSKTFSFADQFYYCRAYTKYNNEESWTEIATTHTSVYDNNTPTLVLSVADGKLTATLPQIYFTNQTVKDSIRIDIYTTKGAFEIDLSSYRANFSADWVDYDMASTNLKTIVGSGSVEIPSPYAYIAPIMSLNMIGITSQDVVAGGSNGMTFEALRQQVISNLSQPSVPITPANLNTAGTDLGYNIVLSLDNVTDRQYIATRSLPTPTNNSTSSGAGCSIATLKATMSDLVNIMGETAVADNNTRITLKPTALFKAINGVITPVSSSDMQTILNPASNTPSGIANTVNTGDYRYSPFYYVLDSSNNEFNVRPYRLDAPYVTSKYFKAMNQLMLINASTQNYSVGLNPDGSGYIVSVQLKPDSTLSSIVMDGSTVVWNPVTQLGAQLSYTPNGSSVRKAFPGTLVSPIDPNTNLPVNGIYVYYFYIPVNWDVDSEHNLLLSTLETMALETTFDLVYYAINFVPTTGSPPTPVPNSDIDLILKPTVDPNYSSVNTYMAVNQEVMTINFGSYLKDLWARCRTAVSEIVYETYPEDVYNNYSQSVFLRDVAGNLTIRVWDTMPSPPDLGCLTFLEGTSYSYVVVYDNNDPVLTASGQTNYVAYVQQQLLLQLPAIPGLTGVQQAEITALITTYTTNELHNIHLGYLNQLYLAFAADTTYSTQLKTMLSNAIQATAVPDANINRYVRGLSIRQWWSTLSSDQRLGLQMIRYRKGDVVLDSGGYPTPVGGIRGLTRIIDMLFVDGRYYFATAPASTQYKSEFATELFDWITQDIPSLANNLLERTELFLYPKTTQGDLTVNIGNSTTAVISATQKLTVSYVMSPVNLANENLISTIQKTTANIVSDALKQTTCSVDLMEEALKAALGDSIISVQITGFAIDLNSGVSHRIISLIDQSVHPTIGKKLVALSDQTLDVEDDITFKFVSLDI